MKHDFLTKQYGTMPSPGLREEQVYSLLSETIVSMKNTKVYYRAYTNTLQRRNCLISLVRVGHHIFLNCSSGIIREDCSLLIVSSISCCWTLFFLRGLQHAWWIGCSVIFCFNELTLLPWRRTTQCCAIMYICSNKIQGKPMHISAPLSSTPNPYYPVWKQKEIVKY